MALTDTQNAWLTALIMAAPDLVAEIVKIIRALGHDGAADDLEVHLANADASFAAVLAAARAAQGKPPLDPAP
jgi:hypothetical protein